MNPRTIQRPPRRTRPLVRLTTRTTLSIGIGIAIAIAIGFATGALARPAFAAEPATTATPAPIRVATLLPFVEDALSLAPERVVVVASVRRTMREPVAPGRIDLGNPHSPNFERLAEANADLIIADRQIHAVLAARFEALGAEVVLVDASGIEATLDSLAMLSKRIGDSPRLDDRIAAVRSQLATLQIDRPLKVLPLFGAPGSFYAITDRAWLGQLVTVLGFRNVAPAEGDERFPGLVVVSDEVISTVEPDLVLLVAHGDPQKIRADLEQRTLAGGAWSSLRNAGLGIHVLDPALFAANPGLDIDRAAAELVELTQAPSSSSSAAAAAATASAAR